MMKSMTWHKSRPVEEALLWTEAKAAEPVDGARGGLRVWKILPLSDNFNDRGGIGCIWEGVNKATRMRRTCGDFLWRWLWWPLLSIPKVSPPTFVMMMMMMTHICRQFQKPLHQHLRLVVHTLEGKHHRIPCDWGVTGGILIKLWLRFGRYFLQEHLLNYWIPYDREGWSWSFDLKFCQ